MWLDFVSDENYWENLCSCRVHLHPMLFHPVVVDCVGPVILDIYEPERGYCDLSGDHVVMRTEQLSTRRPTHSFFFYFDEQLLDRFTKNILENLRRTFCTWSDIASFSAILFFKTKSL